MMREIPTVVGRLVEIRGSLSTVSSCEIPAAGDDRHHLLGDRTAARFTTATWAGD
jgi:hypothetical protein